MSRLGGGAVGALVLALLPACVATRVSNSNRQIVGPPKSAHEVDAYRVYARVLDEVYVRHRRQGYKPARIVVREMTELHALMTADFARLERLEADTQADFLRENAHPMRLADYFGLR